MNGLFTTSYSSLSAFRIGLACVLLYETVDHISVIDVYFSETGIWSSRMMQERSSPFHNFLCVHTWWNGSLLPLWMAVQIVATVFLLIGCHTRVAAIVSWFLYNSLTLRNVWLSYIADRYFHVLLLYCAALPCGRRWSADAEEERLAAASGGVGSRKSRRRSSSGGGGSGTGAEETYTSLLVALYKLQVAWIYFDAGWGKFNNQGWSLGADPLSALDTYTRHTPFAAALYRLLGPAVLRLLTPTVPLAELLATPLAVAAGSLASDGWQRLALVLVAVLPTMHLGIALTITNTVSLSLVASVAWLPFLPLHVWQRVNKPQEGDSSARPRPVPPLFHADDALPLVAVVAFTLACVWFEATTKGGARCLSGSSFPEYQLASVLLNNRWNVFVGADEYVTWEIMPAKLADGRVVDLWRRGGGPVSWEVPSLALARLPPWQAATAALGLGPYDPHPRRGGRWRSFPYLSVADKGPRAAAAAAGAPWTFPRLPWARGNGGKKENADTATCRAEVEAFAIDDDEFRERAWAYLCDAWNKANPPSARVLRYNFWMLRADIKPDLQYGAVTKRLIRAQECAPFVKTNATA